MADFLPNLEDEENWLPSGIIHEIKSTTVKLEDGYLQTFGAHAYSYLPVHILGVAVSPFLMPVIVAYLQVRVFFRFFTISLGHFLYQFHVMWEMRSAVVVSEELMGQVPLSPVLSSIREDMEL